MTADEYFSKGLAQSTIRTYSSGVVRYLSYCREVGRAALPTNEELMSGFVARLAEGKQAYA